MRARRTWTCLCENPGLFPPAPTTTRRANYDEQALFAKALLPVHRYELCRARGTPEIQPDSARHCSESRRLLPSRAMLGARIRATLSGLQSYLARAPRLVLKSFLDLPGGPTDIPTSAKGNTIATQDDSDISTQRPQSHYDCCVAEQQSISVVSSTTNLTVSPIRGHQLTEARLVAEEENEHDSCVPAQTQKRSSALLSRAQSAATLSGIREESCPAQDKHGIEVHAEQHVSASIVGPTVDHDEMTPRDRENLVGHFRARSASTFVLCRRTAKWTGKFILLKGLEHGDIEAQSSQTFSTALGDSPTHRSLKSFASDTSQESFKSTSLEPSESLNIKSSGLEFQFPKINVNAAPGRTASISIATQRSERLPR
ncbi:hypothetical protein MRB53_041376 [Persea americana]|nr:hypothetical protein MRB53_041376 [Persea americana]